MQRFESSPVRKNGIEGRSPSQKNSQPTAGGPKQAAKLRVSGEFSIAEKFITTLYGGLNVQ